MVRSLQVLRTNLIAEVMPVGIISAIKWVIVSYMYFCTTFVPIYALSILLLFIQWRADLVAL